VEYGLALSLGLSVPFSSYPLARVFGFPLDASHLLGAILIVFAAGGALSGSRSLPGGRVLVATALVSAAALSGLLRMNRPDFDAGQWAKSTLHLFFMLGVFLSLASLPDGPARLRRIVVWLAAEALLITAYGGYQLWALYHDWPTGIDFLNRFSIRPLRVYGYVTIELGGYYRPTAIFEEPSWFANYLLDNAVLTYFLWLNPARGKRAFPHGLWGLGVLVMFGGIFSSASLGGLLTGTLLAVLIFVHALRHLSAARRLRLLLTATAACLLLGLALTVWAGHSNFVDGLRRRVLMQASALLDVRTPEETADPNYFSTWGTLGQSSVDFVDSTLHSLDLLKKAPLFGVGLGQYPPAPIPRWTGETALGRETGIAWLAHTGIFGGIAFGLLLFSIVRSPKTRSYRLLPFTTLATFFVVTFILKEAHTASYIHLSSWYPLGLAALASGCAASRNRRG
jgi:hypothetical protein